MTHHLTTTRSQTPGKNDFLILIAAPSHDRLTKYTSKLLQSLPSLNERTLVRAFESPLTYDQLLAQESINPDTTTVALIFCGHGVESALQGPGAANQEKGRSVFYEDTYPGESPEYLLAFCCSAGAGVGESYKRGPARHAFVGFKTDIPILMAKGVYEKSWEKLIHGLAGAMLSAKSRREMKKGILDLYGEEYAYFESLKDSEYEYALLMKMYLDRQREVIRIIKT